MKTKYAIFVAFGFQEAQLERKKDQNQCTALKETYNIAVK